MADNTALEYDMNENVSLEDKEAGDVHQEVLAQIKESSVKLMTFGGSIFIPISPDKEISLLQNTRQHIQSANDDN